MHFDYSLWCWCYENWDLEFFKGCFTPTITLDVSVWRPSGLKSDILKKSHRNRTVCDASTSWWHLAEISTQVVLLCTLQTIRCHQVIVPEGSFWELNSSSAAITSPGHLLYTSLFLNLSHLNYSLTLVKDNGFTSYLRVCV